MTDGGARTGGERDPPIRVQYPSGARMQVAGRSLLNFGGSCYLGLSAEPELVEAAVCAVRREGPHGQLSRHYGFAQGANLDVEEAARRYFGCGGAMYFATGYLFGLIALAGLADDYDVAILDENGHYNLRDGALAAGKPVRTFKHRDDQDLARVLEEARVAGERPLVATDGMFATYGTVPPLRKYRELVDAYDGWLIVDESHSFGVLGATGCGALEQEGLKVGERVMAGGSLGKAFGAYGGLAIGDASTVARLWKSPAARGAAEGMSSGAAMAAASMSLLRRQPDRLIKLRGNVAHLRARLKTTGLVDAEGESPVVAFACGDVETMRGLQADLMEEGIFVIYSTYVGAGPTGAIRIAVFADHEPADIDRLADSLLLRFHSLCLDA